MDTHYLVYYNDLFGGDIWLYGVHHTLEAAKAFIDKLVQSNEEMQANVPFRRYNDMMWFYHAFTIKEYRNGEGRAVL